MDSVQTLCFCSSLMHTVDAPLLQSHTSVYGIWLKQNGRVGFSPPPLNPNPGSCKCFDKNATDKMEPHCCSSGLAVIFIQQAGANCANTMANSAAISALKIEMCQYHMLQSTLRKHVDWCMRKGGTRRQWYTFHFYFFTTCFHSSFQLRYTALILMVG